MEITLGQNVDQEHELLCLLRTCSVEVVMIHPDGDFQRVHEYLELNVRGEVQSGKENSNKQNEKKKKKNTLEATFPIPFSDSQKTEV